MDQSLVLLACFAGVTLTVAAVFLVLRDLFSGRGREASVLGRLSLARDERAPSGLLSRLDYLFNRLVLETGIDGSPLAAVMLMLLCGLAVGGATFVASDDLLTTAVMFTAGFFLPLPYFMYRRGQRINEIQTQLPDVLDLLARAVRAGESLDQAIELAGQKTAEPLAREFRRCFNHLQMGLSLPAAMRAFAHRVRTMEVKILATTLSVHRTAGGNLAETLDRMAHVVRERLTYRRQIRVTTAAGRFSASLVCVAGIALFLYMFFVQTDYSGRMMQTAMGQSLFLLALALEVVGLLWVWRLVKDDD